MLVTPVTTERAALVVRQVLLAMLASKVMLVTPEITE
jgi:hypothetical protein